MSMIFLYVIRDEDINSQKLENQNSCLDRSRHLTIYNINRGSHKKTRDRVRSMGIIAGRNVNRRQQE
jgi:hypothetical protein